MVELTDNKKSSSAFRTIGEVASDLGLPPHVLRFWEGKFTQIKPHKRRGGHRYYRPADIETLQEIKSLLYDRGYTIKGAQKYLRDAKKNTSKKVVEKVTTSPVNDNKKLDHILSELMEIRGMLNS